MKLGTARAPAAVLCGHACREQPGRRENCRPGGPVFSRDLSPVSGCSHFQRKSGSKVLLGFPKPFSRLLRSFCGPYAIRYVCVCLCSTPELDIPLGSLCSTTFVSVGSSLVSVSVKVAPTAAYPPPLVACSSTSRGPSSSASGFCLPLLQACARRQLVGRGWSNQGAPPREGGGAAREVCEAARTPSSIASFFARSCQPSAPVTDDVTISPAAAPELERSLSARGLPS
jgi:hypothetical protein